MITLAFTLSCTGISRPATLDDPQHPRPVSLQGIVWDSSGVFSSYQSLIRQEDKSISAGAEKLHGISDRIARSRGLPERTALSWLTNSLKVSTHVIGWNLDFDLAVIRSALMRHGGNPAALIRPQLTMTSLIATCATIVGKQDENGEDAEPTIAEAVTVIAPEHVFDPKAPHAQADACRALFERLCAEGTLSNVEEAA